MILAIIQARMTSQRLPGKVLLPVLGDPLILHLLKRVKKSKKIDEIVVAIPDTPHQTSLEKVVLESNVPIFRGNEEDVLARYYDTAKEYQAKVILRITADCPLIDPSIIDEVISAYEEIECDYASNVAPRTYPKGLDTEVFSWNSLEKAHHEAKTPFDREHVTPYLRESGLFKTRSIKVTPNYSHLRWTLDYESDYFFIKNTFEKIYPKNPNFLMNDVLDFLKLPQATRLQ